MDHPSRAPGIGRPVDLDARARRERRRRELRDELVSFYGVRPAKVEHLSLQALFEMRAREVAKLMGAPGRGSWRG